MKQILYVLTFLGLSATAVLHAQSPTSQPHVPTPQEQAQQRYETVRNAIGQACELDQHCTAPLRCFDQVCIEPPAMSGQHAEDTPFIRFNTPDGPTLYFFELVTRQAQRQRGLMFRPWMQENWSMLFIFPDVRNRSFWMRNTYIPLDMIFITEDCSVLGVVENAEPLTDSSRGVPGDSKYVLELVAGQAAAQGIQAGTECSMLNLPADLDAQIH